MYSTSIVDMCVYMCVHKYNVFEQKENNIWPKDQKLEY